MWDNIFRKPVMKHWGLNSTSNVWAKKKKSKHRRSIRREGTRRESGGKEKIIKPAGQTPHHSYSGPTALRGGFAFQRHLAMPGAIFHHHNCVRHVLLASSG